MRAEAKRRVATRSAAQPVERARFGRACWTAGAGRPLGRAVLDSGDGDPRGDAADRQGDVVFVSEEPEPAHGGRGVNDPNTAQAWLWDPATGATKRVDPPLWRDPGDGQLKPANIWCAGQTFTADGRLVVFGGNLRFTERHRRLEGPQQDLHLQPLERDAGPSSPTCATAAGIRPACRLADGRIVIMSGLDESGARLPARTRTSSVHALGRPQRARHRQPARHARRDGPAADRRPLPAHVRDALGARAGGRTVPGGHLVPQPTGPVEHLGWQDFPSTRSRPGLGHGGAAARRHGRVDASDAARRRGADELDHRLRSAPPRSSTRRTPARLAVGAVDEGRPRPPQHRAAARRLDGHRRRRRRH